MATSVYPAMGGAAGLTEASNFLPDLWSDEIIASYKKNLVLAQFVRKMSFKGKKGDALIIPNPARGLAAHGEHGADRRSVALFPDPRLRLGACIRPGAVQLRHYRGGHGDRLCLVRQFS